MNTIFEGCVVTPDEPPTDWTETERAPYSPRESALAVEERLRRLRERGFLPIVERSEVLPINGQVNPETN